MRSKFDAFGGPASRLALFVPDMGGPRTLPSSRSTDCQCLSGDCGGFRCRAPKWSR